MRHQGGLKQSVADQAAAWAAGSAPKKRSSGISDSRFLKVLVEVGEMLAKKEWAKARGIHFVALYADLHFRVYGLAPVDLGSKERVFAAKLANTMVDRQFDGDAAKMATFVSWLWTREKEREEWRRQNERDGSRIEWRFQFSPKAVIEFKLAEARRKAGSK